MSQVNKWSSLSPCPWQVGAVVSAGVAWVAARRLWSRRKLNNKLDRKRQLCRNTFKQIERELKECKLSEAERAAIVSLDLTSLQSKLQSGELKAEDVLQAYQHKALKVHAKINCATEAITEAKEQAVQCDETGDRTRLLHGVPLSLKENIGLQGYDTTAGLQINIGVPCAEDSVVVQVFKHHGAIPFVRTNVPQAMLSYTCSNPLFGVTVNPLNTDHTPGGSSGGEGALIGGGGSLMGLGTDVGGSLRVPAAFCGVCSLKPTVGRFSKLGVYSVTAGQTLITGSMGPMARDVHTLTVMTRVLASPLMLELDPSLPPLPFNEQDLTSTHKLKIGFYTWDGCFPPVPAVRRAVKEATVALEKLGHTVVEFCPSLLCEGYYKFFPHTMVGADQSLTLWTAVKDDYKDVGLRIVMLNRLPRWLLLLLAKIIKSKEPVISKVMQHADSDGRAYSFFRFGQRLLDYRVRFTQEWKKQGLDAVICPVFPCPAPKTAHVANLTAAGSYCGLYNVLNFPAGVVPVTKVTAQDVADVCNPQLYTASTVMEGLIKKSCDQEQSVGLPLSVQCVTLPYREELCLRVMRELETALQYQHL